MGKYILKKDATGKLKKVNIILSEHQEEDGVIVTKINPDIFISYNKQSFDTGLSAAIALFEKSLNYKKEEILSLS